jgi:crotonobetainyl-CoA:carnitine CoA-transferase CaiB-like acyl-CoA transferase
MKNQSVGLLSPYRVLELTDEKGFLCGKLLADLGADVIKIEKPGGDPARNIGPFYKDIVDPQKSLYWFAFNTGKRSITLDIESGEGQEIFKRLVATADFVIESFPVGHLDKLGLGYSTLSQINPKTIMTSITPFGQSGPYKDYKGCDLVTMAMAGVVYVSGDSDRPPVRISFPQAYQFAGAEAAVGTLMALHHRTLTGEGQHVDISMHWSAIAAQYDILSWWVTGKRIYRRQGSSRVRPQTGVEFQQMWPCKDGFVTFYYFGGLVGASGNKALVAWMESEGFDCGFMKDKDWSAHDWGKVTQEEVNHMEEPTGAFFRSHTKGELYDGAVERGILLYPVSTAKDMLENRQLRSREYWVELEHPELDTKITYPGSWVRASETACNVSRRAPLIGEHNDDIYGKKELALSNEEIISLKRRKII